MLQFSPIPNRFSSETLSCCSIKIQDLKIKHLLSVALLALFVLFSCDSDPKNDEQDGKEEAKKECQLTSMNFDLGDRKRSLVFEYEKDGRLGIQTVDDGKDIGQTMFFNFHDDGGIQAFLSGTMIAAYVYDDDNKILSINGEKGLNTRKFEYNEKGQIIKQVTLIGDKANLVHSYEYDDDNQPVKVSIYDKFDELIEENVIQYDNKINPFKNKGAVINNTEMLLGFPVGNHDHNIVEITRTYMTNTTYKIRGALRKKGERQVNRNFYKYDKRGYPLQVGRMKMGKESIMTLTYDCN